MVLIVSGFGPRAPNRITIGGYSKEVAQARLDWRDKVSPMPDKNRLPQGSLPLVDGGTSQDLRTGRDRYRDNAKKSTRTKNNRFYRMADQADDAPLYDVFDRSSGTRLGQVRGSDIWALREAGNLAASQGCGLKDVEVRLVP